MDLVKWDHCGCAGDAKNYAGQWVENEGSLVVLQVQFHQLPFRCCPVGRSDLFAVVDLGLIRNLGPLAAVVMAPRTATGCEIHFLEAGYQSCWS